MKLYWVTNSEFNQAHYSDIIGVLYRIAPSYANVIELPDPYRQFECWKCNNEWIAEIKWNDHTNNLSGESNQYCPNCHTKSSCASSWIESNGDPYPFPESINSINKRKEN